MVVGENLYGLWRNLVCFHWRKSVCFILPFTTNAKTFTVGLSEFLTAYNLDLGPMTAAAFMFSFPVMILSIFAQKYIVKGITAGAVKG